MMNVTVPYVGLKQSRGMAVLHTLQDVVLPGDWAKLTLTAKRRLCMGWLHQCNKDQFRFLLHSFLALQPSLQSVGFRVKLPLVTYSKLLTLCHTRPWPTAQLIFHKNGGWAGKYVLKLTIYGEEGDPIYKVCCDRSHQTCNRATPPFEFFTDFVDLMMFPECGTKLGRDCPMVCGDGPPFESMFTSEQTLSDPTDEKWEDATEGISSRLQAHADLLHMMYKKARSVSP